MATTAAYLSVVLDANTAKASASLRRFDSSLGKTDAAARKATTATDRLEKSTNTVGASFLKAAKYAAGAATAYVGISQAKAAISTTTDLAKATLTLNKNLGLSIKTSSEFAAVAKARGVDTRALGMSFGTLSRQIEAAKRGTDTSVTAFKNLGISVRELQRQSPEQTITAVSDGMAKLGAGTERTASSMTLFGRGWQTIVPILRDGSKSMQDQLDLANEYGASFSGKSVKSIEDLIAAERELKIAQLGLQVQFTQVIAPVLIDVFLKFAKWINAIRKGKDDIVAFVQRIVQAFKNLWQSSEFLRSIVTKSFDAIKSNFKGLSQFIGGAVKVISGVLTGDFGKAWDGVKDIFKSGVQSLVTLVKGITAPLRAALEKIADIIKDVFVGAWNAAKGAVESAADAILKTTHHLTLEINKGFQAIFKYTNSALKAFGVKAVAFDLAGAIGQGASQGKQRGGIIHAQHGVMVPGSGSGDKVPAMLEPGEVVLNRKAVAAMGGANKANAINAMIPRFAKGGVAGDTAGLHPGILNLVNSLSSYGATVSSGLRAGDVGSLHSTGQAADVTFSDWAGASRAVNAVGSKLLEGIYNPGAFGGMPVSWDSGQRVPPSFWANEWGNHLDHIHLAVADGASAIAGAMVKQIKRVILNGPDGPLKSMGQAALDKVRGAANQYISKQGGMTGDTSGTSSGAYKGPLDKVFPHPTTVANPGIALSASQVAGLASKAGLNGDTFEKISRGESGHHPGIVGYDPGGTRGLGLWQITTGFNDDIIKRFGGETQMFNPWVNAQAAKAIFDRQGIGAWYGTQFLAKGGPVAGIYNNPFDGHHHHGGHGGHSQGVIPSGYDFGQGATTVGIAPHYASVPKDISDALYWLAANVDALEEQISTAETLAGFFTSELGVDLGPGEKAQQIALNDQLLATLLESVSWLNKGLDIRGLPADVYGDLRSSLNTIQGVTGSGGKILGVRRRLDELNAPSTASATTDNNAELISLLQAQLLSSQRAFNVSQAQYAVFAGMRAKGGPVGAGQWAIAGENGPEVVTGPGYVHANDGLTNVRVVIQDQRTRVFVNDQEVRAIVKDETRKAARGRPLPGVRG